MKKEREEAVVSTAGIAILAPEGLEPSAPPKGVIELSDDESEGLIASFAATVGTGPSDVGPSAPQVTTTPNTSDDWEFARRLSTELNWEEIPSNKELAQKLFVELNREALDTPGDGALVDLVSEDEGDTAAGTGKVVEETTPNDEEEEGVIAPDGSPEQNAVPPGPPSSY